MIQSYGRSDTPCMPRALNRSNSSYTPQDWVKLTTSATDLAGLQRLGGLRGYRMEEVAQHKSPHDAWAVFMGKVGQPVDGC